MNIVTRDVLPQIDPLGCFEPKETLEGLIPSVNKDLYIFLVEAVICVKKDDNYVSEWIAETGAWEEENVKNLQKGIRAYKEAVFVGKIVRP